VLGRFAWWNNVEFTSVSLEPSDRKQAGLGGRLQNLPVVPEVRPLPSSTQARAARVPFAAVAPLVCVVHCLAAPLLLSLAPSLAENRLVEAVLVAIASVVGIGTIIRGIRLHERLQALFPLAAGISVWVAALTIPDSPVPEVVLMVVAGVLVAGAMFWDARLRPGHTCG